MSVKDNTNERTLGDWLTLAQINQYVTTRYGRHWSPTHIYYLIRQGSLPHKRVGTIVHKDDIDAFAQTLKKAPPPLLEKVKIIKKKKEAKLVKAV